MQPNNDNACEPVVVVGAACLDVKCRLRGDVLASTSNSADVRISVGGCARNVAENLARLGYPTTLVTVVCDDDFGQAIVQQTARAGVNTDHVIRVCDYHSPAYVALLSSEGRLITGVDDTEAVVALTPAVITGHRALFQRAPMVVMDANVPVESAKTLLDICAAANVPVALDPVAYAPALRYRPFIGSFALVAPNAIEAEALTGMQVTDVAQAILAARRLTAEGVEIAIVTLAEQGLVYATPSSSGHIPAINVEIVDPTGAGDALTATVVYALLHDIPIDEAVRLGVSAATLTLESSDTVRQDLTLEILYAQLVI
ncbi:carbohydrate kinase family protein [Roseiflexus sp.]|uniref:carbohydrate kinase family protein n=1 Tax=Roseiflexus sp. TaxID=2562120 RepID=UPI00398AEDF8